MECEKQFTKIVDMDKVDNAPMFEIKVSASGSN